MVVLIVENDLREAQVLSSYLKENGHLPIITDSVKSAAGLLKKESPRLILMNLDGYPAGVFDFLEMSQAGPPGPSVIIMTRKPRLEDAVLAMKKGAQDFWVKPIPLDRLAVTLSGLETRVARPPRRDELPIADIISQDPGVLRLKAMAKRVASSDATIFIQGESGTGKELFARYIHYNSRRKEKPFIALNCAALPETLLESELFGHEKGAFTGAIKAKEGKFELAHSSSLLLDEVTEIPLHLQAKLLRVLQENEVDRLGGRRPIPIDIRVIATTNVTMEEALKESRFRKDLYYRLNVIPLKIPPLRDRPEDVALLSMHFVGKYNQVHGGNLVELSQGALKKLQEYSWPGNVRELQNVIQRAVLLSNDPVLGPEHLNFCLDDSPTSVGGDISLMPICEMEKRMIHKALDSSDGNRTRAAELLGISVRTLRNKLNEYRQEHGL